MSWMVRVLCGALLMATPACDPGEDPVDDDDDSAGIPDDDDDDTVDPCVPPDGEPSLDEYGGDERVALEATGFFRAELLCGRWWLVTPLGHPAYSVGVNNISPRGDTDVETGVANYAETVDATYADHDEWADTAVQRLTSWGVAHAGCWSHADVVTTRMPYTYGLGLAADDWVEGTLADYWDPAWEQAVADAAEEVAERAHDPLLVGWFIDNEIRWGPDWRGYDTLLQLYLQLEADAPGKAAAVAYVLGELGDVDAVNGLLGTSFADTEAMTAATEGWDALDHEATGEAADLVGGFLELTADHYFDVTTSAIRAHDPNHLILGNREVSVTTRMEVYRAADPYLDLFSINNYVFFDVVTEAAITLSGSLDPADGFAALHAEIDKPILITEFGFRAADSGLPNSWPPQYPTLDTQADRADAFEEYATYHQSIPRIVGYHWFEWVDQPPGGRFDGEDNNWGVVDEQDQVYEAVTTRMTDINPQIWTYLEVPR